MSVKTKIKKNELEELRKIAESATYGPWKFGAVEGGRRLMEDASGYRFAQVDHESNGRFIAAVNPAVILRLLDYIDDCQEKILELEDGDLT